MGFFDKIKAGLTKTREKFGGFIAGALSSFRSVDDDLFDELEEALILSDVGADTAAETIARLRAEAKSGKLREVEDVRGRLADILSDIIKTGGNYGGEEGTLGLRLGTNPSVILVVGVNGVGKTTTIGKLAYLLKNEGRRVLLAAGDTFRAAAADQLEIWANRAGVDIVRHRENSDPAAVVFDAISAAKARGCDVIICDTAGRLHNKENLMRELEKIGRVIGRELPGADRENLLVLDATTGQNAMMQAKSFSETAGITGIALTKLDGTAKGGIIVAICRELRVPIKFVCVGEGIDDLLPFDADAFVRALF